MCRDSHDSMCVEPSLDFSRRLWSPRGCWQGQRGYSYRSNSLSTGTETSLCEGVGGESSHQGFAVGGWWETIMVMTLRSTSGTTPGRS